MTALFANPLLWLIIVGYAIVRLDEYRFRRSQTLLSQLTMRRRMAWASWILFLIASLLVGSLHS